MDGGGFRRGRGGGRGGGGGWETEWVGREDERFEGGVVEEAGDKTGGEMGEGVVGEIEGAEVRKVGEVGSEEKEGGVWVERTRRGC